MKKIILYIICSLILLILVIFGYKNIFLKNDTNVEKEDRYKYETIYGKKGFSNDCDIDRTVGESYCITNTGDRVVVKTYNLLKGE